MKKIFYVLVLLSIGLAYCKKDKPLIVPEKLIGQWTYVKQVEKNSNNAETLYLPDENYIYDFQDNGDLYISKNGVIIINNKWKLTDNHILRYNDQDPDFIITKLDDHNLIYYHESTDLNGTIRYTDYYKR